jgi:uncharacterized protein
MSRIDFTPEPFIPHPMMRNGHIQTLLGTWFRHDNGVVYRRVRLDTPDDDFIDVDFADVAGYTWEQLGDNAPILFLLHGLEGDARKGYAGELYHAAAHAGYRPVGINFRSCSGEMNRQPRFYHMGATDDIAFVHDWLEARYPDAPIVLVGISLGANMLLKYLGENGASMSKRVKAAVAISPPFIATKSQPLNDNRIGRVYGRYLLKRLQTKTRQKAHMLQSTKADPVRALQARTLREFDEAITAPLHGFNDAHDYYAKSHSINFISEIRVPTLLIRAWDDPFFNRDIPTDVISANACLHMAFTEHGGHVGFVEGLPFFQYTNWAQRQTLRFFEAVFSTDFSPQRHEEHKEKT